MKIFIIAIVIIGLLGVAGSIIVGSSMFEGIVSERPYETGLAWDRMQREKEASGLSVAVKNDRFREGQNMFGLDILDKRGKQLEDALVSVTVSRPSTTAYDKTYNCTRLADGSWRTTVVFPLHGYWDIKVGIRRGTSDLIFTRRVFAE